MSQHCLVHQPREACGVFGIYARGEAVARVTFFALYALQPRGQESAGIAVSDGRGILLHKEMGLVSQVFDEHALVPLQGDMAIGHVRYSTAGSSSLLSAQPFLLESALGPVASESCTLETIGAHDIQEITAGQIVTIDERGVRSEMGKPRAKSSLCIFEYIYFARPDSIIDGQLIHEVRQALGHELAKEHPVDADLVMGVPDSGIPAAIGYAQDSGIPYGEGLIKNRYIGRIFIEPSDRLRKAGVAQVQPSP